MNREKKYIYADNAATTALSEVAFNAMLPYLKEIYANPSSIHLAGQHAAAALFKARLEIAKLLNCAPSAIYFTSGGSEADNQAVLSAAAIGKKSGKTHIVSTAIEHPAVLRTLEALKDAGCSVTLVRPERDGRVDAQKVKAAVRGDTCLVSVMYANNETGALQPVREIGSFCRSRAILFHSDAVQAAGHQPIDVEKDNIDLLALSAHKFHGPKGIGVLYARQAFPLKSLIYGGGQERGRRAGTENLPAIIGMAAALKDAVTNLGSARAYVGSLRAKLISGLAAIPGSRYNGSRDSSLPGTANFSFSGINGESLVAVLSQEGICASSGSACSAGSLEPSHVLLAMGLSRSEAAGAIRFSLSKYNTPEETDVIVRTVKEAVERLRRL